MIEKISNFIKTHIGLDGMMHMQICTILSTVCLLLGLNTIQTIAIVGLMAISKEVYDKVTKKGTAEIKDLICDALGIIIGIL